MDALSSVLESVEDPETLPPFFFSASSSEHLVPSRGQRPLFLERDDHGSETVVSN
jgi:hypothetical protein